MTRVIKPKALYLKKELWELKSQKKTTQNKSKIKIMNVKIAIKNKSKGNKNNEN
jgi:hypothetical protein